ncbi:hypothetical protein KMZ32_10270 [Phycicoccus sp. MAQZ13P-2]|uniref:pilus assembly protein TadG-related protein n=1 Tax=Phycicoccus mangrovi TaxID=2840470 RepID=UPI001BFFDF94|nr:pilus assembly protein TadG-related protein [Phycicoccus mangrovi]MBT9255859.1 hypothetical protein [Phycicoccus mangrovi]MBT9274453.1 hypothetical protein [Phycicoccus mangrovi]
MTARDPFVRDEHGTITVYLLGLVLVAMTLVAGTVAVTSAHLARVRMLDAADGASLAAAGALDEGAYREGVGDSVPLATSSVRARAASYLGSVERPTGVLDWRLGPATGSPDGRTAVVDLSGEAELPLVGGVLRELGVSITVHVTSRARSDLLAH